MYLFSCFFVLSYYVSLRSEVHVVMSLRFPHKTMFGSSLPLVVCRRANVLFTLFIFGCYSGAQHTLSGVRHTLCCIVLLFCFSSSCVPYVASFFGLSIFDCPFGILWRLFSCYTLII